MGGTVSRIFEAVNYIPLETSKESLFGRIDQLFITDEYYIILDYDTNSILFFFKNGKFHCKIEGRSISKRFFPTGIRFFCVNEHRKELTFKISAEENLVFNFEGKKIREDHIVKCNYYYYLPKENLVYSCFDPDEKGIQDSSAYELVWEKKNKIYKMALPYRIKNAPFSRSDRITLTPSAFYASGIRDVISYTRPYDYNIYELDSISARIEYSFIFPSSVSLPQDFSSSNSYYNKRFLFLIREHPQLIYAISHFYKLGHLLFFKLESGAPPQNNTFVYDLESGVPVSVNHISADSSNFFLPVFVNDGGPTYAFSLANFLATDGTFIYTTASSRDMFNAREVMKARNINYNTVLKEYFNKENKTSNPLIIQIKPRTHL
jgi:hypothetical protein